MKIYRVEDKDGWGPYSVAIFDSNWKLLHAMGQDHKGKDQTHPSIATDLAMEGFDVLLLDRRHFCACESLEQLKQWFGEWLPKLIGIGYKIVELTVAEEFVLVGRRQVAYDSRQVVEKKEIKLI